MEEEGKRKQRIRIEDYTELEKLHDSMVSLINKANITAYSAIGILETIKQEIFIQSKEQDVDDT